MKRVTSCALVAFTVALELAAVAALILRDEDGYHELMAKAERLAAR